MKKYIMWRIILIVCILQCFTVGYLVGKVYGEEYKGEYYEKNGCIYLTGNLTVEEKSEGLRLYKERMSKHREVYEKECERTLKSRSLESARKHEVEVEKIRAEAFENYLEAQSIDYNKIAIAIKRQKCNVKIKLGDVTSQSNSSIGDTVNTNTSVNTNSTTGGSGGTSTHNNY